MTNEEKLSRFLGWFSIGLGAAEVAAPQVVAGAIGVKYGARSNLALRMGGLREISAGIGILASRGQSGWLWSRVAGDAMDLAIMGSAFGSSSTKRERLAAATAFVLGITALDIFCGRNSSRNRPATTKGKENHMNVKKAVTINSTPEQLYGFWRDFRNLPRFMQHLESVRVDGNGQRSHWTAKAPAGKTVEWDAEIVEDRPNELISWRSLGGADIDNSGTVSFVPAPGGRGTQVKVEMQYDPPGGKIGSTLAKLYGEEPEKQVDDDLHAFKQVIEVGEVVRSDASIAGMDLKQRPAQPPEELSATA